MVAAISVKKPAESNGQRRTQWTTGIWFLLCMGIAGIVALELSSPLAPQVTAALPPAQLAEFAPEPDPFNPPPRSAFAEIAARPLFSPTRRPFVPEIEVEREAPPDGSIAIELIGTLLTTQGRAALVQPLGQSARWLRAGERIAGWQVETIERNRVTLRLHNEAKTLQLRTDLVQPAQSLQTVERRRAYRRAEPDGGDQAQDEEQELDQAGDGEFEEDGPRAE